MTTAKKLAAAFLALAIVAGLGLRFAPVGASGQVEACVVEDARHRTPQTASIAASPTVREACKTRGIAWHMVDARDSGPDIAEVAWAIDASRGHTLPTLCLRHGAGMATVEPLPDGPKDLVKLLTGMK